MERLHGAAQTPDRLVRPDLCAAWVLSFCSSDADWPTDIAVVYLKDGALVATRVPVRIQGRMEGGQSVDPETGMVSLVRIYADDVKLLQ
ncbi:MAG: hypothetical protein R2911_09885 [Caldilineaceae bacterium]